MGVIRPEVIASQKRSGTFLDYLAQANQSITQLGNFLNQQKALQQQQQQINETERFNHFQQLLQLGQNLSKHFDGGFTELAQIAPGYATNLFKGLGYSDEQAAAMEREVQAGKLDLGALANIGIKTANEASQSTTDPFKAFGDVKKAVQTNLLQQMNRSISDKDFYTPKPNTIRTSQTTFTEADLAKRQKKPIPKNSFQRPKVSDVSKEELATGKKAFETVLNSAKQSNIGTAQKPMTTNELQNKFVQEIQKEDPNISSERAMLIYNSVVAPQAQNMTQTNNVGPLTNETKYIPGIGSPDIPTNGALPAQPSVGNFYEPPNYPNPTSGQTAAPSNQVAPAQPMAPAQQVPLSPSSPPAGEAGVTAQNVVAQTTNPAFGIEQTQVANDVFKGFDVTQVPEPEQKTFQAIKDWALNPQDKKAAYKGKVAMHKALKPYTTAEMQTRINQDAKRVIQNLGGLKEAIKFVNPPYGQVKVAEQNAKSLAKYRAAMEDINRIKANKTGSTSASTSLLRTSLTAFNSRVEKVMKITDPDARKQAVNDLFNSNDPAIALSLAFAAKNGLDVKQLKANLLNVKQDKGWFSQLWDKIVGKVGSNNLPAQPQVTPEVQTASSDYLKNHPEYGVK